MEQILYTTIDRILYFADSQGMSIRTFAKSVGISHSLLGKTKALGSDKLEKILSTYPDLNPVWLLTGKGEMLEKKSEDFDHPKLTTQNDHPKQDFDHPKRPPKNLGTVSDMGGELSPPENVFTGLTPEEKSGEVKVGENMFTGMTQAEVRKELQTSIREYLLDMYENGRAYPAAVVRQYQEQIKELTAQVAQLEYQVLELRGKTGTSKGPKARGKGMTGEE